jgi:hypothetical protein
MLGVSRPEAWKAKTVVRNRYLIHEALCRRCLVSRYLGGVASGLVSTCDCQREHGEAQWIQLGRRGMSEAVEKLSKDCRKGYEATRGQREWRDVWFWLWWLAVGAHGALVSVA